MALRNLWTRLQSLRETCGRTATRAKLGRRDGLKLTMKSKFPRTTTSTIYFSQKQSDSTQPIKEVFAGLDWARIRDVNGKETVVNKPLSFPLSIGKTWEIQYTEQHPNKAHKYEQMNDKYTVVGYESIDVPAGKFKALKIEVEGKWVAEKEPAQAVIQGAETTQNGTSMTTEVRKTTADTASGRLYKAFCMFLK